MPTGMFDDHEPEDQGKPNDEERWEQVRERAQEAVRRASKQGQRSSYWLLKNRNLLIAGGVVAVVVLSLVLYLVLGAQSPQSAGRTTPQAHDGSASQGAPSGAVVSGRSATGTAASGSNTDAGRTLANTQNSDAQQERWPARLARIGLSLALAALLGAVLAFRPRKDTAGRRSPEAARAQILVALLASGLMLVAAGDVAIALTIIGAAVLIRMRPSALESRESIATLVSAGIGLACGAGRWEVALILGGFAFVVMWVLESSQEEEVIRSVDLSVETRSIKETNEVLREVFDKNEVAAEFVRVDTSDPTGRTGIVHYSINVKQGKSLNSISEEIFSEDPDNVLSVNWQQRRWPAVAYR